MKHKNTDKTLLSIGSDGAAGRFFPYVSSVITPFVDLEQRQDGLRDLWISQKNTIFFITHE